MTTLNDWQAESLRLTVFRLVPVDQVVPLWESLTGEKPATVDSQPRVNIIRESGPSTPGTLVHLSNPMRIEWQLIASQEQQEKSAAFPVLGRFAEVRRQFATQMSRWLTSEKAPEINRMAFGAVILLPVESKESAYRQLSALLPHVELDVENSSDFLYQVNRPVKSRVEPSLVINRLSKWSAARTMSLGLVFGTRPEVFRGTVEHSACRLELDINTSQYHTKDFSKGQLTEILLELNELAENIASQGDR